jgi:hypothetical protein
VRPQLSQALRDGIAQRRLCPFDIIAMPRPRRGDGRVGPTRRGQRPGHDGLRGAVVTLAFSRQAIIDAYVTFAYLHAGEASSIEGVAWRARVEGLRSRGNVYLACWKGRSQFEAIDDLDEDSRPHYFALLKRLLSDGEGEQIREDFERSREKNGVKINVNNNDDDPTLVEFRVLDRIACMWAERDQTIAGDSWGAEGDGEDSYAYASTYWHPKLFADLKAEGYDLDLGAYSEPNENDLRVAEHRYECEDCIDGGSHDDAAKHLDELDDETFEAFVRVLDFVARLPDAVQAALFEPSVLYPELAS